VVQLATHTAEELADLFAAQIKLARLELSRDLRLTLKRATRIALCIPPLVVGYAFAMAALSSFLATYFGRSAALGSVAALQIAVASIGLRPALNRKGTTQTGFRATTEKPNKISGVDGT